MCAVCFSLSCQPFRFFIPLENWKMLFSNGPKMFIVIGWKEKKTFLLIQSPWIETNTFSQWQPIVPVYWAKNRLNSIAKIFLGDICKIKLEQKQQINPIPLVPCVVFVQQQLPMSFNASISGDRWVGEALLPWAFFPPNVNKMNSYAIHGSGDGRTYEALYPVPREDLWEGQKPNLWVNWSVCLWLWIFVLFLGGFVWYGFWRVCYFLETKWYLKCKTNKANKTDTNVQNYCTNNHLQN